MLRRDLPIYLAGPAMRRPEGPMRFSLCAFFLCCSVVAQSQSSIPPTSSARNNSFYVNGILYHYVAGNDYTVVAAAHSGRNHKFVAVKIHVYNVGQQSVTIKPEDIRVEDAVAGQALTPVSGTELARRMSRPYNWARLAVNPGQGGPQDTPANEAVNPRLLDLMRAMAAHANGAGTPMVPDSRGALYTDTAGALESREPVQTANCDTVGHLRNRAAASPDVLKQRQRPRYARIRRAKRIPCQHHYPAVRRGRRPLLPHAEADARRASGNQRKKVRNGECDGAGW